MNVVVCVKQVPDPNAPGRLEPGTNFLAREGAEVVLDPGDEFGIEAALQIAEATGGGVTAVSMGPERSVDALRKALAMGAARAVLVSDPALRGADALTTARVLAAVIGRETFDLVIAATESTDGYTGVVPQAIAELLGVPALTYASTIAVEGTTVRIDRQTEVGLDRVQAETPALVTVTAGVNQPRYPSLKGIMGAKSKPLDRPTLADLGVEAAVGAPARQRVVAVVPAEVRKGGEIVRDEGEAAARIVEFLSDAKVI